METFEYYGLFLTENSKNKLKSWLIYSNYQPELLKSEGEYLDHCTLLHKSQVLTHSQLVDTLEFALEYCSNTKGTLEINGIGVSDKAMAFRCNLSKGLCANKIPHITICTFNGGKPVDSNMITEWNDIEPIRVETKLKRV